MKNIRFDLQLFQEGESGCAAEQTAGPSESNASATAEAVGEGTNEGNGRVSANGDTDAVKRIGALLGIDADDFDTLLGHLQSRRARASLDERLRSRKAEKAYAILLSESETLSSKIKDFDLGRELSDKRFRALVKAGLSLEDAYRAVHTDSIIEEARETARREALNEALEKLRRTSGRAEENGTGKAPAKSQASVESLTGRGIRDILRRVENGAKIKF